jgi:uncharacterized delta-60 repeat protein
MRSLQVFVVAAVVACGVLTIPLMAGGAGKAAGAGSAAFQMPTPFSVGLSATGPDQLHSAVAGPNGSFYLAGYVATSPTGPRNVVVVKMLPTGKLDRSFGGGDGVATTALEFKGGNKEMPIAVQPSGKIVVAATVANAAVAIDRDVAVARLNPNGTVDGSFGNSGVRVLDWNSASISGAVATGADAVRGIAIDRQGRIYLIGLQRGEGQFNGRNRTDTDFVVTRLSVNGVVDQSFGTGGKHLQDIRGTDANKTPSSATPHVVRVLADGSVLGGGYAATQGNTGSAQPVVFKLDSRGKPVTSFADNGLFHTSVLVLQTEVYGMAVQGGYVVTGGYGRDSGDTNDWVSLRISVVTGKRDLTWGGAGNGAVIIDPTGNKVADNCRGTAALPGRKTLLLGSTGPGGQPAQDAVFAILDATGRPDTSYGDGVHVFSLGGNDAFWDGAASGSNIVIVGWKGSGATQTEAANDDAYAVLLPLTAAGLTGLSAKVAIPKTNAFTVKANFKLRNGSTIKADRDDVILEIAGGTGAYSATIPAGSFKVSKGRWTFAGKIDGVQLAASIVPLGSNRFEFTAAGKGANLRGITKAAGVKLMIGNAGGSTRVSVSRRK